MTENLQPGLGSGALREAVAFVIETEGGDLYDQGRVLFSDARQAQDRADDLNSELEKESFRVAPLYRALSLSNPIEAQGQPHCPKCNTGLPDLEYRREGMAANWAQAAPEIREALEALLPNCCYCDALPEGEICDLHKKLAALALAPRSQN